MSVLEHLRDYYDGERYVGYAFMIFSSLSLAVGGTLVARGGVARSAGGPMLGVGAILLAGGTAYLFQVNAHRDRAAAMAARDAAAYRTDEAAYVQTIATRYTRYRVVEASLLVAGLGLAAAGLASRRPAWTGVGLGLAFEALGAFSIDSVGHYHARRYGDQLARFDASRATSSRGGARPNEPAPRAEASKPTLT